jgi:hypothetical protein
MVVVQFLTTDPEGPRDQVARGIGAFEIAVAGPVADAIDEARGPERDPHHLQGPDRRTDDAEQRDADQQHQGRPPIRVRTVDVVLDPVIGRAAAVLLHVLLRLAGVAVQRDAVPEHLLDAVDHRAVRIFLGLDLGVVLAMHRHPLTGDHPGGQPTPETEEVRQHRMEIHAAMGLAAMQVQRHREDGELRHDQDVDEHLAPACAGETIVQEIEYRVQHEKHRVRDKSV